METKSQVWYVTGAAEGLGLDLIKQLLAAGYKVAASSRNAGELEAAVGRWYPNFLPLEVNLSNENSVSASLQATADKFGKIDVVVNNADSPIAGRLDQMTDRETRAAFEINVFGMMNVIRNAMPHLRKNQSGHIFNVSSPVELNGGYPGFSIYCATKYAVAGLSESLAAEAKPFGISVTVVLPGHFQAINLSVDPSAVTESQVPFAYQLHNSSKSRYAQEIYPDGVSRSQQVDPKKAAGLIMSVALAAQPPMYLFLGKRAYENAAKKMSLVKHEMCIWETKALNTDAAD